MFFELRQYTCKPGQRARWAQFMDEVIIPYQISRGMVVVGSFVSEADDDLYFWIRRFDSEEQREQLYEAVYKDPEWLEGIAPQVGKMLDREKIVVKRIVPTPRSVIR